MPDPRETWQSGWLEATAYDFVVEHEQLARVLGFLAWGVDTRRFFADIARLADAPDGTAILDLPCGGGVAFRGLHPNQDVRYVAADLSPVMLRRARAVADRRGLHQIEFSEADVEALPFTDGEFDLVVSYTGLHCFPDPAAAIAELARVVRPGGELRGTSVVRGAGLRFDAAVRFMQLAGVFGPGTTVSELKQWLTAAGLLGVSVSRDGALAFFSGRRSTGNT
jgi:ubiquinone/menaquinone biosynthesis C-methylase UbiE